MRRIAAYSLNAALTACVMAGLYSPCLARDWGIATPIDFGEGSEAHNPHIAIDGNGDAIAVFRQAAGERSCVYANRYHGPGWGSVTWDGAVPIDLDGGGTAFGDPDIAFDADNTARAIFAQLNLTTLAVGIYSSRYNRSQWGPAAWDNPQWVDLSLGTLASQPRIAFDGKGNAIAVYTVATLESPYWTKVCANRYNGTMWNLFPKQLDSADNNYASGAAVACYTDGAAIAVFAQSDGEDYFVYADRYKGTGWGPTAWCGSLRIDAGTTGIASEAQIALDETGTAIVVFRHFDGTGDRIYANRYNGSAWGPAAWDGAVQIDAGTGRTAHNPQIAVDGSGEAIVVFRQSDGVNDRIYANRYNGSAWGPAAWDGAIPIDAGPGDSANDPQVAFDSGGNAMAVFVQSDGIYDRIYANFYAGSGWRPEAWEGARRIDCETASNASQPQVAFDPDGNAIAVFKQSDGAHRHIYANRYMEPVTCKVNFQPAEAQTPPGYIPDCGNAYGTDGVYGWIVKREEGDI